MSTLRIIDIAVPNATAVPTVAAIKVAPTKRQPDGVVFKQANSLKVLAFGLSTDRCSQTLTAKLPRSLKVPVQPWDTAFVRLVVETNDPPPGTPANAVFEVTDERSGRVVGGVTVVATTTPPVDTGDPKPRNPCPLSLAGNVFVVELGESPDARATPRLVPPDRPREFVAPISNPSGDHLTGAVVYLEHTDAAGIRFEPVTWTIGNMEPGATFWATWVVDARGADGGEFTASIVVRDDRHEPIRLRARFQVARPDRR